MSFLRPRASSVSETAKREAWRPGLLFYWDSSTPPEVLHDGIATFPSRNATAQGPKLSEVSELGAGTLKRKSPSKSW